MITLLKKLGFCMAFFMAITSANAQQITFSEINYKSDITKDPGDWFELHNYGSTPVNISGWKIRDTSILLSAAYVVPANTTIPAGGYYAFFRIPSKFLGVFGSSINAAYGYPFAFKLDSDDSLLIYNSSNTLVTATAWRNNYPWPDGADGEGRTLQLINVNNNSNLGDPTLWRDGCMFGTPGAAFAPCNDPLIITEINYNSNDTFNTGEFIEIHNTTNSPINIGNYFIRDGIDTVVLTVNKYTFPAGTIIAPNDYIIISNDSAAFKNYRNLIPGRFFGNFDFNLNNGGELLRIYDFNNYLTFSMHYNDSMPWTDSADGKGYTLELRDKTKNLNDGKNWFAGCKLGSPYGPFNPVCATFYPFSISTINAVKAINVLPNPAQNSIKIDAEITELLTANIYNSVGQKVLQANVNAYQKNIDISQLPNGFYQLLLKSNNALIGISKFIKQ
jgi:hypothetical protein